MDVNDVRICRCLKAAGFPFEQLRKKDAEAKDRGGATALAT
jgi:hypothetical protein